MIDTRELILTRLVAIANTVTGVETVTRNSLEIDDQSLPAIVILDADEEIAGEPQNGRDAREPLRLDLKPHVAFLLQDDFENAGPRASALRLKILKAILYDAELRTILGSNGRVRYIGMNTMLGAGREMGCRGVLQFAFTYHLKPWEI